MRCIRCKKDITRDLTDSGIWWSQVTINGKVQATAHCDAVAADAVHDEHIPAFEGRNPRVLVTELMANMRRWTRWADAKVQAGLVYGYGETRKRELHEFSEHQRGYWENVLKAGDALAAEARAVQRLALRNLERLG